MLTAILRTYIVWNSELTECDTYRELCALEMSDGMSHSSRIESADIQATVNMVMNEFSGTLAFELVPAPTQH